MNKNIPEKKRRIREALIELMETLDADRITAVDLARKAGVSRATVYRYYSSVDDVLREMSGEFLEGMRDSSRYYVSSAFDLDRLDVPYPAVVAIAEYVLEHKKFVLAMMGPHGDGRFVYRFHQMAREFYIAKLAYESLAIKEPDVILEFVLAGHDAVIRYWLEKRQDLSPEQIAPIVQRVLYGPFVA